jgi:hypothetical protein
MHGATRPARFRGNGGRRPSGAVSVRTTGRALGAIPSPFRLIHPAVAACSKCCYTFYRGIRCRRRPGRRRDRRDSLPMSSAEAAGKDVLRRARSELGPDGPLLSQGAAISSGAAAANGLKDLTAGLAFRRGRSSNGRPWCAAYPRTTRPLTPGPIHEPGGINPFTGDAASSPGRQRDDG